MVVWVILDILLDIKLGFRIYFCQYLIFLDLLTVLKIIMINCFSVGIFMPSSSLVVIFLLLLLHRCSPSDTIITNIARIIRHSSNHSIYRKHLECLMDYAIWLRWCMDYRASNKYLDAQQQQFKATTISNVALESPTAN